MTDGIDPTRLRRNVDLADTDPPPTRTALSRPLPTDADWPDASFGPLPHVKTDVSAQRVADTTPKPPVQARLDQFLESATPTFVVDGDSVAVPIPFRMTVKTDGLDPSDRWRTQEAVVTRNAKELKAAASSVGLGDARNLGLLRSGRAAPQDVQKVTQALIDRGCLPARGDGTLDAGSRVRQMMFDYGLGLDCAGYTQQAFLASRGIRREQTQLKPDIANENLTALDREGFRQVQIEAARAGDILVLDPPAEAPNESGHTLVVYDRREATTDELRELRGQPGFQQGHITAYVLDSSYGSHGTPGQGGVMRQTWWRNDDLKNWSRKDPSDGTIEVWSGADRSHPDEAPRDRPYVGGHLVRGVYRPAGEPR